MTDLAAAFEAAKQREQEKEFENGARVHRIEDWNGKRPCALCTISYCLCNPNPAHGFKTSCT